MQNYVALFGGAFDPFHNGHQYIINQLKLLNFKKIILVPTGVSAFNKNLTEAQHRINMINIATKDVEISKYEVNQSSQINFTIETIKFYLKTYPQLALVIGEDCFYTFDKWKDWKEILELVKIIVIKRKSNIDEFFQTAKTKKIDVEDNYKKFQFIDLTIAKFEAGGVSDVKRISSIFERWRIVEKTLKNHMYYCMLIIKEILKIIVKRFV